MNLFELFVKVGVDDQASGKLKDLGGKLGNGLKTAAKIGTAAVGAAAAGITALTTAAVNNYAEYEQLVGGVDTLFKASSQKVQEYAANAYKTAGMSANEYMSTVTSFSASLLQSLGGDTDKAAEYANQALTDMSDNANKMGTSMEMIQNAYQGFAKQNYTMLDNLKLGYGGTKEEMARLIEDAAKLSDTVDAQDMSFANIVKAINVVQDEMGITGTTALEAGRTISGSVGAMKSAWTNLVTGFADGNADIEGLINNLVTTIVGDGTENNLGVLGNIMPAVKMALKGAAKVVAQSAPIIAEELPKLMEEILPDLASATANLIVALAEQIPSMAQTLVDATYQIVDEIGNAFAERIPGLSVIFENLETVVISLTAAFAAYKAATAISGIIDALRKATEGQTIAQALLNAVMNANPFVLIATLIAGLVAAIITLWNTNEGFRNALIGAWDAIKNAAVVVWESIVKFFTEDIPNAFNAVINFVKDNWQALLLFITNPIAGALKLLYDLNPKFKEWVDNLLGKIKSWIGGIVNIGKDIVNGLKKGIQNAWTNLKNWFKNLFGDLIGIAKKILGIASPSKVFKKIGGFTAEGFGAGFEDEFARVKDDMEDALNFDDASVGINASIRKVGAGAAGGAFGGTSIGNININIDGAKYSDEQSLASAIALEIQNMTDRRAAVYA